MQLFENLKRMWGDRSTLKISWMSPFWVFLVFFAVMLAQNSFVYLYHDDYGYASLGYAVNTHIDSGFPVPPSQLIQYLTVHYNRWGGGVIPLGIEILVLRWGIWPFRILQSIFLTLTLVAVYTILSRYYRRGISRWLIAFTLCCCYGLIDVQLHRNGTYWPTASISYAWPFLALFTAASIHLGLEEGGSLGWRLPIMGILYFAVGAAQEQIGLAGLVFASGLFLAHAWRKQGRRLIALDGFAFACLLAGFAFLVLAPGEMGRLFSPAYAAFRNLSLAEKLGKTLPNLVSLNLGPQNRALVLLWTWSCVAVTWESYRSGKRPSRLYFIAFLLCAFFGILLTVALLPGSVAFQSWIYQTYLTIGFILFWATFICGVSLAVTLFCLERRFYSLLALFAGGLLSQAVMALSPTLNPRTSLVFLFTLFPVLAAMLAEAMPEVRGQTLIKLVLVTMFVAASLNTAFILRGYAANSAHLISNDLILRQAAQAINNGAAIRQIKLHKLKNDLFAGEMPYKPGYTYINWWIKEYYGLPTDINLVWK